MKKLSVTELSGGYSDMRAFFVRWGVVGKVIGEDVQIQGRISKIVLRSLVIAIANASALWQLLKARSPLLNLLAM